MTRGKIVLITNNNVITSNEFNGDMGYNSLGEEVVHRLKNVNNAEDLMSQLKTFNENYFEYAEDEIGTYLCKSPIVFSYETYFSDWFSDYIYIKNSSDTPQEIVTRDYNPERDSWFPKKAFENVILSPGEIGIFNFGRYYGLVKNDDTVELVS